ncbi:MAG: hypothetical protein AAF492_23765 [Verrucomicrobiota bacterium]
MKKWLCSMLVAGPLAMGSAPEAKAGDEGWAALGGFFGGLIVSEISHRGHDRHYGHRSRRAYHEPARVVYEEPVRYTYKKVKRKRWVEGYYTHKRLPCGRVVKKWHPGHYETYYERIKVPAYGGYSSSSYGGSCRY